MRFAILGHHSGKFWASRVAISAPPSHALCYLGASFGQILGFPCGYQRSSIPCALLSWGIIRANFGLPVWLSALLRPMRFAILGHHSGKFWASRVAISAPPTHAFCYL